MQTHLSIRGSLETRRECEVVVPVAQQSGAGGAQQWPQSLLWIFGKGNGWSEKLFAASVARPAGQGKFTKLLQT